MVRCRDCGRRMPAREPRWGTWRQFCSRRCAGRHMAQSLTLEQRQRGGREGGRARAVCIREDVITRFEKLGRDGYWLAYSAGRHALKVARQAAARKAGVA